MSEKKEREPRRRKTKVSEEKVPSLLRLIRRMEGCNQSKQTIPEGLNRTGKLDRRAADTFLSLFQLNIHYKEENFYLVFFFSSISISKLKQGRGRETFNFQVLNFELKRWSYRSGQVGHWIKANFGMGEKKKDFSPFLCKKGPGVGVWKSEAS